MLVISALLSSTKASADDCVCTSILDDCDHCIFFNDGCDNTCAYQVANALPNAADNIPSTDDILADVLPEGLSVEALTSGDPTALLDAAGVELPAGMDMDSIAGLASGDLSSLDLTALTGGLVPEGLDIGAIQALAAGDISAIGRLDFVAIASSFGIDLNVGGIDFGVIISGLLGSEPAYEGDCDPESDDYSDCREEEDIVAAEQAAEDQAESDAAYQEAYENPETATTGLACNMDGMVDMAQRSFELFILPFTLIKEITALAMVDQPELMEALQLMWSGTLGSTQWVGYLLHMVYALGIDNGYSTEMCETIGGIYLIVDEMSVMTTFAQPTEEAACDPETDEDCEATEEEACDPETDENCEATEEETTEDGTEEATEESTEDAEATEETA